MVLVLLWPNRRPSAIDSRDPVLILSCMVRVTRLRVRPRRRIVGKVLGLRFRLGVRLAVLQSRQEEYYGLPRAAQALTWLFRWRVMIPVQLVSPQVALWPS